MSPDIQIDKFRIGPNSPCFVIAEIGVNHEGDFERAKALVTEAKRAGVDAVKFQIVFADTLYPPQEYGSYFHKLFKAAELSFEQYHDLKLQAESLGMSFFASFNNKLGADWLERLGGNCYKIASTQLTNLPLVRHVAKKGKPTILSTGMASYADIENAVLQMQSCGNEKIVLLHCVSSYPVEAQHINLNVMNTLKTAFGYQVGYSDHYAGSAASVAAVALGARVIEKHFTNDKSRKGFDHAVSSSVDEMAKMISEIREVEKMLGTPLKKRNLAEEESRIAFRVSLAASRDLRAGEIFTEESLCGIRPGDKVPTSLFLNLVGKPSPRDIKAGEHIRWSDFSLG